MKQKTGKELPGMPQSQGARIGVIEIAPDDDRQAVLPAILAEDRLKREKIVLILPQKNKAFQRPEDFDALKMLRRNKLQAELIFVTPSGPGPATFARQRSFRVFSTEESFVRSITTGNTGQANQSVSAPSQPNNKPGKKGLFGIVKKVVPTAAAGAAGFAAGEAVGRSPAQRRRSAPRPASGLTPASDMTDLPTQQPVAQRPSKPLRSPQTPPPQIEDEDEDTGWLPPSSVDVEADTLIGEHGDENQPGISDAGSAVVAADTVPHTPPTDQGASPDPNIDKDEDDLDALPPAQGQSMPSKLPSTPAATGTAGRKATSKSLRPPTSPIEPAPIVFPMPSGTAPKGPKPTKKLPVSAGTAPPTPTPTESVPTPPRSNGGDAGNVVAAGTVGAVAGATAAGALTSNPTSTGQTPTVSPRSATSTSQAPTATPRNAGAGRTLTPAGSVSAVSAGWPPPGGPMSPRRTPPNRNRRAVIIVALVILTMLVICGVVVSANPAMIANVSRTLGVSQPPPATIAITPASQIVQDTYLMQGVTDNANADNRQVTVRQLGAAKTATDKVNATGHAQILAKTATGTLTFHNGSTLQQTIAPTRITNANGIQVIADQNVTIPGANPNTGAPGQASVSAHAVPPGANGNIAAGSVSGACCLAGGFITVTNTNAFTGGVNAQDYHFLQESDITPVTNAHQGKLKSDAQSDTNSQKKSGEQFLGNTNCADPKTTADQPIGDKGKNVTSANVTVSVTCNAKVYDANAVQAIAQKALQQKAMKDPGKGYVLAGRIVTQVQPQTQQDGPVTFSVTAKGLWYYQWTDAMKQDLRNSIKGKSTKDAQTVLNSYPGVDKANHPKIAINNGATTLPSDPKQISLDVKVPNGLSGGGNQTPVPTSLPSTPTSSTPPPTSDPLGS